MKKDYSNYYYKKMPDENFHVDIFKKEVKGPGPITDSHWHEHIQFFYFTEGNGFMICNSKRIDIQPKDVVVINGNELHYAESLSETLSCYIIKVDFSFLYSNHIDNCQTKFIAPLSNNYITFQNLIQGDEQICNCLENIIEEYFSDDIGFELAIKSGLYKLIVLLLRNYVDSYLTQKQFDARINNLIRMNKVFIYIDDNITQKISLHDLAVIVNISDYHFCKLFKQVTGKSTIDYINNLRINKAILLLNEGKYNITEVALACGFCDSNYFSRMFKKYEGTTPKNVKKLPKYLV